MDELEKVNSLFELPQIFIFTLGVLSTYEPFSSMTPEEVWEDIRRSFCAMNLITGKHTE